MSSQKTQHFRPSTDPSLAPDSAFLVYTKGIARTRSHYFPPCMKTICRRVPATAMLASLIVAFPCSHLRFRERLQPRPDVARERLKVGEQMPVSVIISSAGGHIFHGYQLTDPLPSLHMPLSPRGTCQTSSRHQRHHGLEVHMEHRCPSSVSGPR